jgi:three-Cys-motif partner protein
MGEDTIGPWSRDKLNLLGKYLQAYVTIFRNQEWCQGYYYIDAFAGSGKFRLRDADAQEYIDGSPFVALRLDPAFSGYFFVEISSRRAERLQELVRTYPDRQVRIFQGDSNKILVDEIIPNIRYADFKRGFIFLDPFGMQVEWQTVEKIAEARSLEIFLNFPLMALNRSVLKSRFDDLSEKDIERMNRFWGSDRWMEEIYSEQKNLFDEIEWEKTVSKARELANIFKGRLEEVFDCVSEALVMRNSKNAPLYCLFYAGHNATGRKITNDIFKKYEHLGT